MNNEDHIKRAKELVVFAEELVQGKHSENGDLLAVSPAITAAATLARAHLDIVKVDRGD